MLFGIEYAKGGWGGGNGVTGADITSTMYGAGGGGGPGISFGLFSGFPERANGRFGNKGAVLLYWLM
jgi:hypothetical protein